jgi:hypothetical protein
MKSFLIVINDQIAKVFSSLEEAKNYKNSLNLSNDDVEIILKTVSRDEKSRRVTKYEVLTD